LTEPDERWSMAGALRRIIREADRGGGVLSRRVSPNRAAIRAAREVLNRLADTLDDPGPVAATGVAQARLLITDGTGPLYSACSGVPLSLRATQAVRQLRPWAATSGWPA
jgi:hypothetical protein